MSGGLRRVAVLVPLAEAEQGRALMVELAPEGFEERDLGHTLELAAYTDQLGEAELRAAFGRVQSRAVAPGWEDAWRAFHRPVQVAGLWLGPPWETAPAGVPAVVIDPGRAFGTGAHATTLLCVELLAGLRERGSLLDVGCGSGVLAIAAARLGYAPLVCVDVDEVAVTAARANARANGVAVDVRVADALTDVLPRSDVVVANISLVDVERALPRLPAPVAVTSGYPAAAAPDVPGWTAAARRERDGWGAHVLRRTSV